MADVRVYLDLDGTVVDFIRHSYRLFGLLPEEVEQAYEATTDWDAMYPVLTRFLQRKEDPVTPEEFWARVGDAGEDFWTTVPWLPWGQELLQVCNELAPTAIATTPTRHPTSVSGKLRWIAENAPKQVREYHLTTHKHDLAKPNALLIDDRPHNVRAFREHGGRAMLIQQPWNHDAGSWKGRPEAVVRAVEYVVQHFWDI